MSELQGLPKGYTKKILAIRCNTALNTGSGTGVTQGDMHFTLAETLYNVVYVDWVSVANVTTYATASTLLGKFIQVEEFKNDGHFTKSTTADGLDFRYWAYIDSQSNQTNAPFPDDMFPIPINISRLRVRVFTSSKANVNCTDQMLVLAVWCNTS